MGSNVHWTLQDITGGIPDGFLFKDNATLMQKVVDLSMTRASLITATIMVGGPHSVSSSSWFVWLDIARKKACIARKNSS